MKCAICAQEKPVHKKETATPGWIINVCDDCDHYVGKGKNDYR